ncbi:MAG: glycosyltransferase [Pseudomonadota bacterium]
MAELHQQMPPISVIVPFYQAAKTLRQLIEALLTQDYSGDYEILLVDNNSTDEGPVIAASYGSRVKVLEEPVQGSSAARNKGIAESQFDLLAFTDADCVPRADWLSAMAEHWSEPEGITFVGGPILAREPANSIARFVQVKFDQRAAIETFKPPAIITANILARRRDLETVGLFDLRYLLGQDSEISFRGFFEHQASFSFCAAAVVEHENVNSLFGLISKGWEHGTGSAYVWAGYSERLGVSPVERARKLQPYADALLAACALLPALFTEGGEGQRRRDSFYNALFDMGKQAAFAWHTLIRGIKL